MICPYCAEEIKDEAIKCKHCHEMLYTSSQIAASTYSEGKSQSTSSRHHATSYNLATPIELKGLKLAKDNFSYKGAPHYYDDIISISYQKRTDAVNGVTLANQSTLLLKLKNNEIITIKCNTGLLFQKNKKLLPEIYKNIFQITYKNILQRYFDSFSKHRYVDYHFKSEVGSLGSIGFSKTARIYNNGDVEIGDRVANLEKARTNGVLVLGTEYGYSLSGYNRPHEIAISETKGLLPRRLLKINAQWDTHIIFSIFKKLSEGNHF